MFALITGDRSTSTPWEGRDAGIEHCIADEPALTIYFGSPTVSVFHLGGAQNTAMIKEAFGLAPVIRNCVVDCITLGDLCLARDVRALSIAWSIGSNPAVAKADPLATVAAVTTSVHDLTAGDRVRVSSTTAAYNGVFLVTAVINATQFTVDV